MASTLSQLAEAVAGTSDPEVNKTIVRRIVHWQGAGLFRYNKIDIGPAKLGRGRVRRYSDDSLKWCKFWNALADLGFGISDIINATGLIRVGLLNPKQKRMIEMAWKGEGPATFLFADHVDEGRATSWTICHPPIELSGDWRGGWFVNLTEIYTE